MRKRGAPLANGNAIKHGRFTREARAQRRADYLLLCEARQVVALARPFARMPGPTPNPRAGRKQFSLSLCQTEKRP